MSTMPTRDIMDVSEWNGPIAWDRVSSVQGAVCRAVDGSGRPDDQWRQNRMGMLSHPFDWTGAYVFATPKLTPPQLAKRAMEIIDPWPGCLIMLDVEPDGPAGIGLLTPPHIEAMLEAFTAELPGHVPLLYLGAFYGDNDAPAFRPALYAGLRERWPWWLPWHGRSQLPDHPSVQAGRPVVWQWAGDAEKLKVPGVPSRAVDLNQIIDLARLKACRYQPPDTPEVPTVPTPAAITSLPYLLVIGTDLNPAWIAVFACYSTGAVRHVGKAEFTALRAAGVPLVQADNSDEYRALAGTSGTAWEVP